MNLFDNEGYKLLVKALMSIETEEECRAFLDDLMTKKELLDVAQRILVAKMLSEDTVYSKIVEETGASTATISRVNRSYLYGSDGYAAVFKKMGEESK